MVGNARYEKTTELDNTTNDAEDLAAVLSRIGFDVMLHRDIRTRGEFRDVVRAWREALAAGEDSVGLFFYAGHAVQVGGENYLIPTAADLQDVPDLDLETLTLEYVTAMAGDAGNPVNLFFIDACRDNPFRGFSRSMSRGLAPSDTPEGSLIVYAASPGKVASDGAGRNSPFTANLLREITTPEHVLLMLQNVVKGVRQDTGGQQQPWFHASLTGDFYFNPLAQSGEPAASTPPETVDTVLPEPAQETVSAAPVEKTTSPTQVARASTTPAVSQAESKPSAATEPSTGETALGSAAPAAEAIPAVWRGAFRAGSGPGAEVTLRLSPTADGGYDVEISRLINYGELPVACGLAGGRLMPIGPDGLRFVLTHPGCRGSGMLRLEGSYLGGQVKFGERTLLLELGPVPTG